MEWGTIHTSLLMMIIMNKSYLKYAVAVTVGSVIAMTAQAQSTDRDYIRLGNRYYRAGQFQQAETNYRKALDKKQSFEALYNLGNALVMQRQDSTANRKFGEAIQMESPNRRKMAYAYHNVGNLFYASGLADKLAGKQQAMQAFQLAVQNYKSALRLNPDDNETRYNLALAQQQLKQAQKNGGGQSDKQQQDKKNQQDKQDKKQQDKKQPEKKQPKPQPKKDQMDDKTAEQLLNSAQQDEKNVQRKVNRNNATRRTLEKDW